MVNVTIVPLTLLSVSSCWKDYSHGECHHSTTHCCQCQVVGKGDLDYQHGESHHSITHSVVNVKLLERLEHGRSHHSTIHSVLSVEAIARLPTW